MKIYAFDVDDTLEVSGGPISIVSVDRLKPQGHIVGLNGNWAVVVQRVPLWHRIFSFVGPMEMSKDAFLNSMIRALIPNLWSHRAANIPTGPVHSGDEHVEIV